MRHPAQASRRCAATCRASGARRGRSRITHEVRMKIVERTWSPRDRDALVAGGIHPVLARVYAGRSIKHSRELEYDAALMHQPALLKGVEDAARLLADAIAAKKRLLIVADYDADGATACAVGLRALRAMIGNSGASVDYLVPD